MITQRKLDEIEVLAAQKADRIIESIAGLWMIDRQPPPVMQGQAMPVEEEEWQNSQRPTL
jgi:hypothetical protein